MLYDNVIYRVKGWGTGWTVCERDDRYALLENEEDPRAPKLVIMLNQTPVNQLYTNKAGRTVQCPTILEVASCTQEQNLRDVRTVMEANAAYKEWLQAAEEKYHSCEYCRVDNDTGVCLADGYPVLDCPSCTCYMKRRYTDV